MRSPSQVISFCQAGADRRRIAASAKVPGYKASTCKWVLLLPALIPLLIPLFALQYFDELSKDCFSLPASYQAVISDFSNVISKSDVKSLAEADEQEVVAEVQVCAAVASCTVEVF